MRVHANRSVRAIPAWIALTWLLALSGCGGNALAPTPPAATVTSLTVTGDPPGIGFGSRVFIATATMSNGSSLVVSAIASWESSNTAIATVTGGGNVTAVAPGEVEVRATYLGVTGARRITIQPLLSAVRPTLFGVVMNALGGSPVVGATVTIVDGANSGRAATSDGNGYYSIGLLQQDTFTLRISKSGYLATTRTLRLDFVDVRLDVALTAISPPQPVPSPSTTFLSLTSDPGDFIGLGRSYQYSLAGGVWSASVDTGFAGAATHHVRISVASVSNSEYFAWDLDFEAPGFGPLAVGTYANIRGYPSTDSSVAGFRLSGNAHGCNSVLATFTIQEIVTGPQNSLDRFRATFEQHCDGVSAATRGEISIAANPWR